MTSGHGRGEASQAVPRGDLEPALVVPLLSESRPTTAKATVVGAPQFGGLLDALPDGLVIADADGMIVYANRRLEEMSGYDTGELQGQPIERLIPERMRELHERHRARFIQNPMLRPMGAGLNIRLRRKDGSDLSADVSLSPLATAESRVVLATIRDVSDRREAEERLRRSEERFRLQASRLEAIAEVTRAILESRGGEEVLQIVASRARELVDAAVACVMTPDETGEMLLIRVADGDMAAELVGSTLPADGWFGPSLTVPLSTEEHVLGAVTVGNHAGGSRFTDDDLRSLELFCAQASVALEHGRIRSQLQRLAVVEDRERIARELHDGIVQALFAVGLGLLSAEPIATDPPVKARLHEAVDSIDRVIADLRRYIFGLKPHAVSMDALGNAVMTLASEFQARTQIVAAVDIDRRLEDRSGDQVAEVVQVAREALSNVARHAHATTCRVSLRYEPPDAVLEIDDDGRGFDLEAVPGHGYGLDNLRERAAGLGGTLELTSNPGQGTTMRLTFPIDPQAAPAGG